jgi:hypothetical protein
MGGIEGFGIISICMFVGVFTGALIWACFQKKPFMNSMGTMPLRDGEPVADEKGQSHHE